MDPKLVRAFMVSAEDSSSNETSSIVFAIFQSIKARKASFLSLVQALGDYLTNEDTLIRAKGTALLSLVLSECAKEQMNPAAANVNELVDFYCDRLADPPSVPQLLRGLVSLQQFQTFSNENAIKISKAIFESVKVQSLQQTDRHIIFQIFDGLLKQHLNALQQMGSEFVFGFIQVMDGEKDPRNLLLAFSLVKYIIANFDINEHVEGLFEVTFCYFPITFKPPPDDVYGITADDLKVGLRECFSATPHFANQAMPLLLEKLASSSGNAKKDSMETLTACAPIYGANSLIPYLEDLWDGLKIEIFHSTDDSLESYALDTIRSIASALSSQILVQSDPLEQFLQPIIKECLENIKEPELRLAKHSGRILKYCATASDPACNILVSSSMRVLLEQYKKSELITQKKAILEVLMQFLEASRTLYGSIDDTIIGDQVDQDFVTPLLTYKDEFFEIFSGPLVTTNEYNELRLVSLKGLYSMILIRKFLSDNEIGIVLQHFNQVILTEYNQEIKSEVLNALANVAHYKPNVVLEVSLPAFIAYLPDDINDLQKDSVMVVPNKKLATYNAVLDGLTKFAVEPSLFEVFADAVIKKLNNIQSATGAVSDYLQALLSALHNILIKKSDLKHSDIARYVDLLLSRLLAALIGPTLKNNDQSMDNAFLDLKILKIVAGIISIITRNLDIEEQSIFVAKMFKLFIEGDTSFLAFSEEEKQIYFDSFKPLSAVSNSVQQDLCILFAAVVGSIQQEVPIPVENISNFLSDIEMVSLSTSNERQRIALLKLAASIVNKWKQDDQLKEFVHSKILVELQNYLIANGQVDQGLRSVALSHFLWFTKALLLRAEEVGYECTGIMINLFNDVSLGRQASEGFDILVGEDDVLNKKNFAVIKLFPLLIHSLSLPEPQLKISTIDTFYMIAHDAPHIISEHVTTLVPLLLSLSQTNDDNTMHVRISALRCLGVLPDTVRFDILYPYKNQVVRELVKVLDDKKRLVRKEAVDCRNKW
ncbi:3379_t:CDS:10 [Ambispora leptoticha]|uniref:MMS19 nucleotide excision repair protein n=1 Tax=Ambispora leptoticha TaxID=144679 RepID=A0A9N9CPE8_9GLOM|nr:3379_t:CDS:10 [Ambispora leptoticha]